MSGFKVGDEVVVVQRHRVGVIEQLDQSPVRGLIYWVRFSDEDVFFYTEDQLGLKSDLDKSKQLATVSDVRELLLSDEFVGLLAKRMNEKLFDVAFKPFVCGVDNAKGDSVSVDYEWAGKENEVQNERSSKQA